VETAVLVRATAFAAGIVIRSLHLGHLTFFPANSSLAVKVELQLPHVARIAIYRIPNLKNSKRPEVGQIPFVSIVSDNRNQATVFVAQAIFTVKSGIKSPPKHVIRHNRTPQPS
jgi:hypothetical protein